MKHWLRFSIISVLILGATYIGLIWFGVGGMEKFQPPFEIVIPQNVQGVVCATSRPGTTEDTEHVVRHEVRTDRLLEVNGNILRSHRPRRLYVKDAVSGQLAEIPSSKLSTIYTENDSASGQWYSVMWLGSTDEWNTYRQRSSNTSHCLGKFGKVAAK